MRVFLIHGMGRTTVSLALLAGRLKRAGHDVSSYGYLVSRDPLDVIGQCFVQHIERHGGVHAPFGAHLRPNTPRLPSASGPG